MQNGMILGLNSFTKLIYSINYLFMFKITTVCHACVLVEIDGLKILTDPWIVGPNYANNHWVYPPSKISPEDIGKVDYIFFSHGHEDHLQKYTIDRLLPFNKETIILIPDYNIKWWEPAVKSYGLRNTKLIGHNQIYKINENLKIKVLINDKGDMDASLLISYKNKDVFIQTDNLMSYEEADRIGNENNIILSYLIPTLTGPWPSFFDFEPKVMKKLVIEKRDKAANYALKVAERIKTKYVVPFACDQFHYGESYHINSLARGDKLNYINLVKEKTSIKPLLMQTGDSLEITDTEVKILNNTKDIPDEMDMSAWAISMRKEFKKYESYEKKYYTEDYAEDIEIFMTKVEEIQKDWSENYLHVRWIFIDEARFKEIERNTFFGSQKDKITEPNLVIEIATYRIQNLMRGEYHMGFPTFNSGCMKIFRNNEYQEKREKEFFNLIKNINFKNKKIDD